MRFAWSPAVFVVCAAVAAQAASVPRDSILPLHTSEASPREIIRARVAAARRLYPQLDAAAVRDAAAALKQGHWTPAVAEALPFLLEQAAEDCQANHPAAAMALLRQMEPILGGDMPFRWIEALADEGTGDIAEARLNFDEVLMHRPDFVPAYLYRGLSAGEMGSIPRMKADMAIAHSLDPKAAADFASAHKAELAACTAAPRKPADVLNDFLNKAGTGASVQALMPLATELTKAVYLNFKYPQERFQDRLRIGAAAIEADPRNAQPYADLATYIYWDGKKTYGEGAVIPILWEADRILAMRLANEALAIDPRNVTALATKAWLFEQDNQNKDALALAEDGLKIEPAYPRFTKLQSIILNASGITAQQAAARERATKFWTVNTPDWIITYSRPPSEDELKKARAFDAMSAANISDANRDELAAWQKFGDTIEGMNDSAGFYQWIGQPDKAVALWKKVVDLDPENAEAMEALEQYAKDNNLPDQAADWQLRAANIYSTTANPLIQEAAIQIEVGQTAEAGHTLVHALQIDPSDSAIYMYLGRVTLAEKGAAKWLAIYHCGEALCLAHGRLHGVDLGPSGKGPVSAAYAASYLAFLSDAYKVATHYDAAAAQTYSAEITALNARIYAARTGVDILADNKLHGPDYAAESAARNEGRLALQQARFEHLRVLLADHELEAAARACLEVGSRTGIWHEEVTGPALELEYPIYLYLRTRLYRFQLWHYFGPATLEHYEAEARVSAPANGR